MRPIRASRLSPVFDQALQLCLEPAHRRLLDDLRREMLVDPHEAQRGSSKHVRVVLAPRVFSLKTVSGTLGAGPGRVAVEWRKFEKLTELRRSPSQNRSVNDP